MRDVTAIPTVFRGVQFRSRLEARWAALFQALRWSWTYEPCDYNGWIPDFVLNFHRPLLVEVKPALTRQDLEPYAEELGDIAGDHEILLLGATFWPSELWGDTVDVGMLRESEPDD